MKVCLGETNAWRVHIAEHEAIFDFELRQDEQPRWKWDELDSPTGIILRIGTVNYVTGTELDS